MRSNPIMTKNIFTHRLSTTNYNASVYLHKIYAFNKYILYGKCFLKATKVSNEMKCRNKRMTWNTQYTNLSWYMPKVNVDHTINGHGTAISTLAHTSVGYNNYYALLKSVSLWNQCDIPHSGIVCDITPLQNIYFDIIPVLSNAYVACVFIRGKCQLIKTFVNKEVYLLFLPNSMLFIINSVILSLQLDRIYEIIWIAWYKHKTTFVWCAVC